MKIFIILLLFANVIFAQEMKQVNATKLNVRNGPSTEYEVVKQLEKGQVVKVISTNNGWSKLVLDKSDEFYVSSKFLQNLKENEVKTDNGPYEKEGSNNYLLTLIIVGVIIYYLFFKKNKGSNKRVNVTRETETSSTENRSNLNKQNNPKYICECCGYEHKHLSTLTALQCSKSQTGHHIPYAKGIQPKYFCKYCGYEHKYLSTLTAFGCSKSPIGKHRPL